MRNKQRKRMALYVILTLILFLAMYISGQHGLSAFAATYQYTGVIEDLQKDESFSESEYPEIADDYSLQAIQIAESTDGELFVYVYQPSRETLALTATCINMSLSESVSGAQLYDLTLLNSRGVFCKYAVKDFTVSEEETRYYNITSIYRAWIEGVDEEFGNDNEISEVAFPVGVVWRATTDGEEIRYECKTTEVISVIDKYVDFLRYPNGFYLLWTDKTDSHYVAFSTDKQIEKLLEAEVYYVTKSCTYEEWSIPPGSEYRYGEATENMVSLRYDEVGSNSGEGMFGTKYVWNRIESVTDFKAKESLSDECLAALQGKQWVLRFAETHYEKSGTLHSSTTTSTVVSEVSILRLKFETQGKVYNLGVVDNKQTGDEKPGNNGKNWFDLFCEWLESVTGIPALVWKIIIFAIPVLLILFILSIISSTRSKKK